MKIDSNTTLIIIGTLVVAAGAYWYVSTRTLDEPPLTPTTAVENQAQTQFQTLVSALQPISFNTAIFSDPRFRTLVDLATPIAPEPAGRLDPFASIVGAGVQ